MVKPEVPNRRVLHLTKRFLSLPLVFAKAVFAWAKARLRGLKSEKALRDEDQVRQSRARRELRGLPPDHEPEQPGQPAGKP